MSDLNNVNTLILADIKTACERVNEKAKIFQKIERDDILSLLSQLNTFTKITTGFSAPVIIIKIYMQPHTGIILQPELRKLIYKKITPGVICNFETLSAKNSEQSYVQLFKELKNDCVSITLKKLYEENYASTILNSHKKALNKDFSDVAQELKLLIIHRQAPFEIPLAERIEFMLYGNQR